MPNVSALDEIALLVFELRALNISTLTELANRLEQAVVELGVSRPATQKEVCEHISDQMVLKERKYTALELFRKWNDITGFVPRGISYEGELESIIEDAVEVGYYGRPVTNAEDWDDTTEPGGPSGIRKDHSGDGERGAEDQEDVLAGPSDLQPEREPGEES